MTVNVNVRGFTLLELMAALAITLVLLTIALPAYEGYRHRIERTQALQGLTEAARCTNAQRVLQATLNPQRCRPASTRSYRFLLVPARGGLAAGHEWRAEPIAAQRGDSCGTLVLNYLGQKSVLGTPARGVSCWRGR